MKTSEKSSWSLCHNWRSDLNDGQWLQLKRNTSYSRCSTEFLIRMIPFRGDQCKWIADFCFRPLSVEKDLRVESNRGVWWKEALKLRDARSIERLEELTIANISESLSLVGKNASFRPFSALIPSYFCRARRSWILFILVDHFNHGPPMNRPMMLIPQQQQPHLIQHLPSSFAYGAPAPNFQQAYHGNPRMPQQQQHQHPQQQQFIFIPHGPHTQQLWMGPSLSLPPAPTPNFIPSPPGVFHHPQPSYPPPPPQPSFSGGNGIPQLSFSGGTAMSQPLLGAGTGIPQPPFSGGTATLKRKSHYLDESDFDGPVSVLWRWRWISSAQGGLIGIFLSSRTSTMNIHLWRVCKRSLLPVANSSITIDRRIRDLSITMPTDRDFHPRRAHRFPTRASPLAMQCQILTDRTMIALCTIHLLHHPFQLTKPHSNKHWTLSCSKSISSYRYFDQSHRVTILFFRWL